MRTLIFINNLAYRVVSIVFLLFLGSHNTSLSKDNVVNDLYTFNEVLVNAQTGGIIQRTNGVLRIYDRDSQ